MNSEFNVLSYIKNNNEKTYLCQDGSFKKDIKEVLPIELVFVSSIYDTMFFRLKCFNKFYLTCNLENDKIDLVEKENDYNLLYKQNLSDRIYFVKERNLSVSENQISTQNLETRTRNMYGGYNEDKILKLEKINDKMFDLFTNGFCILDCDLYSSMKEDFMKAREIVHSSSEKRIHDILKKDVCFQRLLCHPEIKNLIKRIFGDDYHITTYSSNRVKKDNEQCGYHVDYPYHNLFAPYPIETLGLQLLILLDDFRPENGGTEIIKGSHTLKYFPNHEDIQKMQDKKIKLKAKKGSVVIWLGKLWHNEGKSEEEELRAALLANFSPLKIEAKDKVKSDFTFTSEGLELQDDKLVFSN